MREERGAQSRNGRCEGLYTGRLRERASVPSTFLYDGATKTVYQLDDQMKPVAFAGAKVSVTGTLDAATKTINVDSIKAAS